MPPSRMQQLADSVFHSFWVTLTTSEKQRIATFGDIFNIVRDRCGSSGELDTIAGRKRLVLSGRETVSEVIAESLDLPREEIQPHDILRDRYTNKQLHSISKALALDFWKLPEQDVPAKLLIRTIAVVMTWCILVAGSLALLKPWESGLTITLGIGMICAVWSGFITTLLSALLPGRFGAIAAKTLFPDECRTVADLAELLLVCNFRRIHDETFYDGVCTHPRHGDETTQRRAAGLAREHLCTLLADTLKSKPRELLPSTRLNRLLPLKSRQSLWRRLGDDTIGCLPPLLPPIILREVTQVCYAIVFLGACVLFLVLAYAISLLPFISLIGGYEYLEQGGHLIGKSLLIAVPTGVACFLLRRLIQRTAYRLPEEIQTVGDLADFLVLEASMQASEATEAADGFIWAILRRRLAIDLCLPLEEVQLEQPLKPAG